MKRSRREWVLVFLASTLILAWTSLPSWTGHALQDDTLSFAGTFFYVPDYSVHIAMMRAGEEGAWRYQLRFTTEAHDAYPIRMFYLMLGQANRLLQLDPELLFEMARWVFGYAALFALFGLLKKVFRDRRSVWLSFLLAALGSGLGYLQMMFGWVPGAQTPVDLWLIDGYVLFSLALFPHFAFTLALMCAALVLFLDYLDPASSRGMVWLLIPVALLVQLVNPIAFVLVDIAMAAAVLATWWRDRGIRWSQAGMLALLAAVQVPLLAYNISILTRDPIWRQYTLQNETLSPAPIYYVWGYGLFWPLVIAGIVRAFRRREPALIGTLAWVIAAFLLAYAPIAIQRRFLLGITIPLSMLAVTGLESLAYVLSNARPQISRRVPLLMSTAVLLTSMTSIILPPAYVLYMQQRPPENFYPRPLDKAFAWITAHSGTDDFLLAAEQTGYLAAEKTGRRVFLGHPMETINVDEKRRKVSAFFRGQMPSGWLSGLPVQWVIYGPYERKLAPDFEPGTDLELAYQEGGVQIYRVR